MVIIFILKESNVDFPTISLPCLSLLQFQLLKHGFLFLRKAIYEVVNENVLASLSNLPSFFVVDILVHGRVAASGFSLEGSKINLAACLYLLEL